MACATECGQEETVVLEVALKLMRAHPSREEQATRRGCAHDIDRVTSLLGCQTEAE
jgi:hypothetical protein